MKYDILLIQLAIKCCGGSLVVSVLAFYSNYPSKNPADYKNNFLYEKTKENEKEAGVGPFKKNSVSNESMSKEKLGTKLQK